MARAARAAPQGLDPLTLRIPQRGLRTAHWLLVITVPLFAAAFCFAALAGSSPWGMVGGLIFTVSRAPAAIRELRCKDPSVVLDGDRCTIRHGALRGDLVVARDELHSIVPVWLRAPGRFVSEVVAPVQTSRSLPLLGAPTPPRGPALVLVLANERRVPGRTRPIRGAIVAVEDLDVAQRAFQRWGLLARLTPGAFDWLYPTSSAQSPGPLPVYGT